MCKSFQLPNQCNVHQQSRLAHWGGKFRVEHPGQLIYHCYRFNQEVVEIV